MSPLEFQTFDTFASKIRFSGNPAAVMRLEDIESMPDDLLQLIAREFNLSETAFVSRCNGSEVPEFNLRWFTVRREVSLCSHATLAAAKYLFDNDPALAGFNKIRFNTKAGVIYAAHVDGEYEVDFPADLPVAELDMAKRDQARSVFRKSIPALATLNFDIYKHKRGFMAHVRLPPSTSMSELTVKPQHFLELDGLVHFLTCDQNKEQGADFTSRSFAPVIGIEEDSVTGTAHTALAPFYSNKQHNGNNGDLNGTITELIGFQASERTGLVKCIINEDRVTLRGRVVDVLKGNMEVPM